ncbi:MAG TPA: MgtC/SapB family protein [Solirubrobacteraceae bacterium]|nr:MgtC/SapB family protein [Solirubrobacteraceae bacterium]
MAGTLELVGRLGLALVLSAAIGFEREMRQKSAGLRTYTLVGLGAALFSIAGAYGFQDELGSSGVPRDPSRVAAQVVSGIGFIGAGPIFVRQDAVRGLTTAAGVWLTAAVGLAAAAGQAVLAIFATVAYMVVAFGFPRVTERIPRPRTARAVAHVTYLDGRGILREAIARCTGAGFSVVDIATHQLDPGGEADPGTVSVRLELQGTADAEALRRDLAALDGVLAVGVERPDDAE